MRLLAGIGVRERDRRDLKFLFRGMDYEKRGVRGKVYRGGGG